MIAMSERKLIVAETHYNIAKLIVGKSLKNSLGNQALVITIRVTTFRHVERLKKAIFNKLCKLFYGRVATSCDDVFGLLISEDVEASRTGKVSDRTLSSPYDPHLHCLMVFSKSDWLRVEQNIKEWSNMTEKTLVELDEVKRSGVYVDRFDPSKTPLEHRDYPLTHYASYCNKSKKHANRYGLDNYNASVFPYDILANDKDKRQQVYLRRKLEQGLKI